MGPGGAAVEAAAGWTRSGGAVRFKPRQRHLSSKGQCRGGPGRYGAAGRRGGVGENRGPGPAVGAADAPASCRGARSVPVRLHTPPIAAVGSRGNPQPPGLPGSIFRPGFMGISIELKLLVIP